MTVVQSTKPLRLREKLLVNGPKSLSDTELLAVFISTGSPRKSCLELASDLIDQLGDLRAVLNSNSQNFKEIHGLGEVRYIQLQAVKEMCRRSDFIFLQRETQLTNTHQTYSYLKKKLRDCKNETFAALFLDNQNRIIAYEELFTGTINAATVHARPIIERSLK
jgi:DNA repair protein RadC